MDDKLNRDLESYLKAAATSLSSFHQTGRASNLPQAESKLAFARKQLACLKDANARAEWEARVAGIAKEIEDARVSGPRPPPPTPTAATPAAAVPKKDLNDKMVKDLEAYQNVVHSAISTFSETGRESSLTGALQKLQRARGQVHCLTDVALRSIWASRVDGWEKELQEAKERGPAAKPLVPKAMVPSPPRGQHDGVRAGGPSASAADEQRLLEIKKLFPAGMGVQVVDALKVSDSPQNVEVWMRRLQLLQSEYPKAAEWIQAHVTTVDSAYRHYFLGQMAAVVNHNPVNRLNDVCSQWRGHLKAASDPSKCEDIRLLSTIDEQGDSYLQQLILASKSALHAVECLIAVERAHGNDVSLLESQVAEFGHHRTAWPLRKADLIARVRLGPVCSDDTAKRAMLSVFKQLPIALVITKPVSFHNEKRSLTHEEERGGALYEVTRTYECTWEEFTVQYIESHKQPSHCWRVQETYCNYKRAPPGTVTGKWITEEESWKCAMLTVNVGRPWEEFSDFEGNCQ